MSVVCACAGGRTGAQVCQADGTYGACNCGDGADTGAPVDSIVVDTGVVADSASPIDSALPPGDSASMDTGAALDSGSPLDTGAALDSTSPADTGLPDTGVAPDTSSPVDVPRDTGPVCAPGFADCNGTATDGCETSTATSASHCGGCGRACSYANAAGRCAGGTCALGDCAAGFGNCDASEATGCETDTRASVAHCGACGNACPGGQLCVAGACRPTSTCAAPRLMCGGACVDPQTDGAHCGRCGNACAAGTTCVAGACASICAAGTTFCAGACVDTRTDARDCGACGVVCPSRANAAPTCAASACGIACNAGFGDCDGSAGNGCETDVRTAATHCGRCGNACAAPANGRATCTGGACGFVCDAGYMPSDSRCVPTTSGIAAPRQVAPLSTATVTSRRPTLRWALPTGADGAHVDLCRNRAMTTGCIGLDATGTGAMPGADLEPGLWYWRVQGRSGGTRGSASSPVWQFHVGARSAGVLGRVVDTSWGTYPDVNGDGYADVLVGAPGPTSAMPPPVLGRVYVYLGGPRGVSTTPAATLSGAMGDRFGSAVASAGDVNGDGFADVVVGAPGTGASVGVVYVYFGSATGLPSSPSVTLAGTAGLNYGGGVSSAGDVNGDGYADIIVGEAGGEGTPGNAYIYHGGPSGPPPSPMTTLAAAPRVGGQYLSVAWAGDVNGDGFGDVVTSSTGFGARLHFGSASGVVTAPVIMNAGAWPVAGIGDTNGDGYADFATGGVGSGSSGSNRVYVFLGRAIGSWSSVANTVLTADARLLNGFSVAAAGDVNGDGYGDLVTPRLVFHGSPTGLGALPATELTGEMYAVAAGDYNGDGLSDVAGSSYSVARALIFVSIGSAGVSGTAATTLTGPREESFGISIAMTPARRRRPTDAPRHHLARPRRAASSG